MKISIARAHELSHRTQFFSELDAAGNELLEALCRYQWSPMTWNGGRRLESEFISSSALVLDFDDGKWSLDDAEKWVRSFHFRAIIGLTRSHQIEKSGRCVDRFRIVVPWTKPIIDVRVHRQNHEKIFRSIPADKSCVDGARSYRPFKAIHSVHDGKTLNWDQFRVPKQKPVYYVRSSIAPWICDILTNGAPEGQRNGTCFRVAANLAKNGFSDAEIESMIIGSAIDLPEREKRDAARSGIRAGRGAGCSVG
jgi:hypothetical protein